MEKKADKKWRVLCNDELWFKPDVLKPLESIADIDYVEAKYDILLENIDRYDAYFATAHVCADKRVIERADRLKVIATSSTGIDHIDTNAARARGIKVFDISKEIELLNTFTATAEMTWCLLLALIRKLPWAFDAAKNGEWARQKFSGYQLFGKTLGILGYGRLGKMVAEIGKGYKMRIIAHDLIEINDRDIKQVDIDALLSESDVLSIHVHLTEETRGLLSKEMFLKMKHGINILNTSRGAIIDEEALLNALETGKVGGAGLDVIQGEWNSNLSEHPLIKYARTHDNLIITPHIGGSTVESIVGARKFMAEKLANYLKSLK